MQYAVIPGRVQRVRAKRGPLTGSGANPESRSYNLWIPGSRWRAPRNDNSGMPLIEIEAWPTIGRAAT
jgi:hypothetical protein